MEILVRLAVIAAAIFGAGGSTQRHFAQLRFACFAIDAFLPLFASGEILDSKSSVDCSNPSEPSCGAGSFVEAQGPAAQAMARPPADPAEGMPLQNDKHEDKGASSESNLGTRPLSGGKESSSSNEAARSDLVSHGTQLSMQEREEAEQILKTKYGSIDANVSILADLKEHGTHMTLQERKDAEAILRQKYGAVEK